MLMYKIYVLELPFFSNLGSHIEFMQIKKVSMLNSVSSKMFPEFKKCILNVEIIKLVKFRTYYIAKNVPIEKFGSHIGFMQIRHISPRWIWVHF